MVEALLARADDDQTQVTLGFGISMVGVEGLKPQPATYKH